MKTLHHNLMQMDKDLEEKCSSYHDTYSEYAYAGGTTGHQDYNHPNADVISLQSSKSSFYNYKNKTKNNFVYINRQAQNAQSNNSPNISPPVSNYILDP